MKAFYHVLVNALIVSITNNTVWFAVTFWAYLQTNSVIATSLVGGIYIIVTTLLSFWFGSLVDHHRKKDVMLGSSFVSLAIFSAALLLYISTPPESLQSITSISLWSFILLLMLGVIAGNPRAIAVPTLVGIMIHEDERDRANGLSGTLMGVSFMVTSVISGILLSQTGMTGVLFVTLVITLLAIVHMFFVQIPEEKIVHTEDAPKKIDIRGTIKVIQGIPGMFSLLFFAMFNNFLAGAFMSLMDAYGLSLVDVQTWGFLWGLISLGFIVGGSYVAKKGLGKNPLHTLMLVNIITWTISIFFTIQPSIILLTVSMFLMMCCMPAAEAAEQTVIQKVVPQDRQGRVFGFAQSVEWAATPITALLIGPITQFIFIPFMTTGAGVELIGSWYGVGQGRGIALVFTISGILGLIMTLYARNSKAYHLLSAKYLQSKSSDEVMI